MKPLDKVKWGTIGCGDVTEVKSGPALQLCEGSELVAVMRRSTEKAKDYASRHKVPKWFDNADELINDPEINAIYVATPPDTHHYYTIKALHAGKPVYVEKPMAMSYTQCREMIGVAEKNDLPLFVAFYRRMLPSFLKAKELVEQNAIGEVRFVNLRLYLPANPKDDHPDERPWRVKPEISGGGYFVDLAPHQLDFLDYLFGPIVNPRGFARNQANLYEPEDIVSTVWEFESSSVIGNGNWCFTVNEMNEEDIIEIVGSNGSIELSCFDHANVYLRRNEQTRTFRFEKPKHVEKPLIQTVVNELRGIGECPSHGDSGARTNWVMDQILGDYYP
ncbi:MAG: Gfo/Idh/MocA family protein [Bacteroidales bacterium]